MIPEFLNEFKKDLEKYKLESVKIKATPLKKGDKTDLTQSKFLGNPYLPIGMEYPKDENGKPMILFAQINFSEIPNLPNYPTSGILQLFASPTEWWSAEEKDYKIIFHENIEEESQTDFSFLTEDLYEDSPIECEHKLSFEKSIEYGGIEDFRFDMEFNGKDIYDYIEELTPEQHDEIYNFIGGEQHKIGGYASFTQDDPRECNLDKCENDVQLLQIVSEIPGKIMFGDCGIAHLFINEKSLIEKKFNKAWFAWDCC